MIKSCFFIFKFYANKKTNKIRHNHKIYISIKFYKYINILYTYSASGWKDQLVRYNDEIFEHDQLGNPVVYRNKNLCWNRLRNLINYNNEVSFEYNFNGIRTGKISNGVTTKYYINGSKILAQSNGNMLYFHYGAEGVLGFTFKGVGNFNYIKNIFGDIVGILDSANKIIVKYVYDAWGNHKTLILSESGKYVTLSKEETYTDIEQNYKIIAEINPFRYRGYYYDIETGLYYLNSRYYDPEVGRFINADSLEYLETNNFNGLNLYTYCLNNPVNFKDQNGNYPNTNSEALDLFAFLAELGIGLALTALSWAIKTSQRPNNIGIGIYLKTQTKNLQFLTKFSNIVSKISTIIAITSIAISVYDGIKLDISRNYSKDRIISNAIVNTVINSGLVLGVGALGGKIGSAIGSIIPGLGNIIGAAVGFAVGILIGTLLDIKVNGVKIIDHISNFFYDFWNWLFCRG